VVEEILDVVDDFVEVVEVFEVELVVERVIELEEALEVVPVRELELALEVAVPVLELDALPEFEAPEGRPVDDALGVCVKMVVGAVSVVTVSVVGTVRLVNSGEVTPDTETATLVARSDAVPHPNWENPPSKTFR
jgi:hypothetical protein